jgi:hypothetical protein
MKTLIALLAISLSISNVAFAKSKKAEKKRAPSTSNYRVIKIDFEKELANSEKPQPTPEVQLAVDSHSGPGSQLDVQLMLIDDAEISNNN